MSRLTLPIPPSVNASHRNVRINLRIKTDAAKLFLTEAGWLAKQWARQTEWHPPDAGVKVILRYWVYWPDRRKRDADNLCKMLMDSLSGILYLDDRYVLPQAMDYAVDKNCPRVEVELETKP